MAPPKFTVPDIKVATVMVPMRDGIRLATDLYLPPTSPAPVVVMRTPYERGADANVGAFMSMARRGFAVVVAGLPRHGRKRAGIWDYYVREPEDSYDLVEWITQPGLVRRLHRFHGRLVCRADPVVHGHAPGDVGDRA